MAVLDKRTFNQFDILTASDTNAYLVNDPRPNYFINGAFDFWQRGTSSTATGFVADRWRGIVSGTGTTTFSRVTLPPSDLTVSYGLKIAKVSGATTGDYFLQRVENVRNIQGTVTYSLYAYANAVTTLTLTGRQYFGAGGSTSVDTTLGTISIPVGTTLTRYSITATLPSISGKTVGTASDDYVEFFMNIANAASSEIVVTGIQLEVGTGASPFRRTGGTIGGELALCQRYYEKSYEAYTNPGNTAENGAVSFRTYNNTSATLINARDWRFCVAKRAAPTVRSWSVTGGALDRITFNGADVTPTIYAVNTNGAALYYTATTASNIAIAWHWTAEAEL